MSEQYSPFEIQVLEEDIRPDSSGAGEMTRVRALINGSENWYVRKRFMGKETADSAIEKSNLLAIKGFPVVQALIKVDNNTVFIPDLTVDGSRLYGKYEMYLLKIGGRKKDPKLDDFVVDNFSDSSLISEIQRLVDLGNSEKVALSLDDPFELLVHPNLSWKLLMLDLKMVTVDIGSEPDNSKIKDRYLNIFNEIRFQIKNNPHIR